MVDAVNKLEIEVHNKQVINLEKEKIIEFLNKRIMGLELEKINDKYRPRRS